MVASRSGGGTHKLDYCSRLETWPPQQSRHPQLAENFAAAAAAAAAAASARQTNEQTNKQTK